MELDVLELRIIDPSESADELDFPVVAVTINGVDLRDLVNNALRRRRPEIEFTYTSDSQFLHPLSVAPPSTLWLGRSDDEELVVDGHMAVLVCSCGAFGCGGTAARIEVREDVVAWDDFIDPWGNPTPVGSFRFGRAAYDAQLRQLK
jgi:hypothetical protein